MTQRVISLPQPPSHYSDKYERTRNLRIEQLLQVIFAADEGLMQRIEDLEAAGVGGFGGSYFGRRYFAPRYFG